MNNLNGNRKNEFRRKQEEKQRKLALKIKDEAGELREGSLKSEEAIPSLDELCAMGERVEQQTTFSAKEAIRNKIKARRDAERYKTTSTDSEKWTPNPFEDSNAAAIESPKNEDTLNTTRKHADWRMLYIKWTSIYWRVYDARHYPYYIGRRDNSSANYEEDSGI